MESVIEFKLPELGENIEQGDLVRLMITPGATVSEGQAVMELETDKAVVEVPSSVSGTIKEIMVKEGDKIKVGQVVFTTDNNGTAASEAQPQEERSQPTARRPQPSPPASAAPPANHEPPTSTQSESESKPRPSRATDAPAASEFRLQ